MMNGKIEPVPASIVQSICAVMTNLEAVKKSQKNEHGKYMFASTDDIYAAITRKMGEVGLICMCLEEETPEITRIEKKDGTAAQWMKATYTFVLATADATWTDPRSRRTLFIQITGPQTFQAAQSYAEKSYLRSLFKIPTGDMDLDSLPADYEYSPISFKKKPSDIPPPPPEMENEREFLAEMTAAPVDVVDEGQLDLEATIAADLVRAELVSLQTKALNCTDRAELDEAWECFEAATDGKLCGDDLQRGQDIYDANLARLA